MRRASYLIQAFMDEPELITALATTINGYFSTNSPLQGQPGQVATMVKMLLAQERHRLTPVGMQRIIQLLPVSERYRVQRIAAAALQATSPADDAPPVPQAAAPPAAPPSSANSVQSAAQQQVLRDSNRLESSACPKCGAYTWHYMVRVIAERSSPSLVPWRRCY